jgi:hypothetical protein
MLDICEDLMQLKGGDGTKFKYGRLDGMTARARRNLAIRLFNNDPGMFCVPPVTWCAGRVTDHDARRLQGDADLDARWRPGYQLGERE